MSSMDGDLELDKTLMCRSIGKAVADFVCKSGIVGLRVSAVCDEPDVSYDSDGVPHHGFNVRVYVDLAMEDDDDDEV